MNRRLSLFLLGTFQAKLNGELLAQFTYDKVRALLAYLAVESGSAHRRDTLAGLFWPEQSTKKARHSLSQALLTLRQALNDQSAETPFIMADGKNVALNAAADVWLDVAAFEALLARIPSSPLDEPLATAVLDSIQQATLLYQGDFLKGLSIDDSTLFDEWLVVQQERLHRLMVEALSFLSQSYEWRGDYADALQVARRLVDLEPWNEEVHRDLIRLFAYTNQRSAALNQYKTCRRTLAEEFGVEPDSATEQLVQRIQDAEEKQQALPMPATQFIGRKEELAQTNSWLAHPDCRLLTIVGPGGIGKTRLALQIAQGKVPIFLDGVFFISAAALETTDSLMRAMADAIAFKYSAEAVEPSELIDYLRQKEKLLVFDNFEHLLHRSEENGAVRFLITLLENAPGVKLLVTSRERINTPWEKVFELRGLRCPETPEAEHPETYDSLRLFVQCARTALHSFELTSENKHAVTQVCCLLDGIPLAIELAATWVRAISCADIVQELEKDMGLLQTTSKAVSQRHRSMQAVFDNSWRLLRLQEAGLLATLSVFRGDFTRVAATQITGASLSLLAALVDKSLLRRRANGRYVMHELIHHFAAEKLAAKPELAQQIRQAHGRYFSLVLAEQTKRLAAKEKHSALTAIQEEIENIRTAWHWFLEYDQLPLLETSLETLYQFFILQGRYREGQEMLQAAIIRLSRNSEDEELLAKLKSRLASCLCRLSDYDEAEAIINEATNILRRINNPSELALALSVQGDIQAKLGNYKRAENILQESLAYYDKLEEKAGRIYTLILLGNIHNNLGSHSLARDCYEDSLVLSEEMDDQWGKGMALHGLGHLAYASGDYVAAEQYYEQRLTLARQVDDRWGTAASLNNLGNVAYALGQIDRAEQCYLDGLAIRRNLGSRRGIALLLNNLGVMAFEQGEYDKARQRYQESSIISQEIGDKRITAMTLDNLGELSFALGEFEQAKRLHEESLQLFREIGQTRGMMYALNYLASVCAALNAVADAKTHYREALSLALFEGAAPRALDALLGIAELLAEAQEPDKAVKLLTIVIDNPASEQNTVAKAEALMRETAGELPAARLDAATLQGKKTSWETAVRYLLKDE